MCRVARSNDSDHPLQASETVGSPGTGVGGGRGWGVTVTVSFCEVQVSCSCSIECGWRIALDNELAGS